MLECVLPVTVGHRAADSEVELDIPPNGTGGSGNPAQDTTFSSLTVTNVAANVATTGIAVHVTLVHQRVGDLTLTLITPIGDRVPLAEQRGGTGSNYLGTVFDDRATTPICNGVAAFEGDFLPEVPIGTCSANGTWGLEILDGGAGNVGRLIDWSIDFTTARTGYINSIGVAWGQATTPAPIASQGCAKDAENMYFTGGTIVAALPKADFIGPGSWSRDMGTTIPRRPMTAKSSTGADHLVVIGSDGFAYDLNRANGATLWSRNLRRPSCSADTLIATPVEQIWARSNCEFQTAIPSLDLVYVGTAYACGTTTANKVYALSLADGAIRWVFNSTGTYSVDRVTGLALDEARNLLFVTTEESVAGANQGTLIALNTLSGARVWARDLDSILVRPVVSRQGVYVLESSGELHRIDPVTGVDAWTFPLTAIPGYDNEMAFDPLQEMLFLAGPNLVLHAVRDDGNSASSPWRLGSPGFTGPVVVTPFTQKLYASGADNTVHQLVEATGALESYATVSNGFPVLDLVLDDSTGGGLAGARLLAQATNRVARLAVPWNNLPGDHGGLASTTDPAIVPHVNLSIQGITSPPAPSVGDDVIDTLTVTNFGIASTHCVEVNAPLPPGMSFVGGTASHGTVRLEGTTIVTRLGPLQIWQVGTVTVNLRLTAAGPHARTYSVSNSELPDPYPANDAVILN